MKPSTSATILRIGYHFRSCEARNDPAAVDVADQDDGNASRSRKSEIGDVVLPQIDLGHRARAFDEHEIRFAAQTLEAVENSPHETWLELLIFAGLCAADHAALHYDLRPDLALRLQEHGVHVNAGSDTCGACLKRLRPPDLAAICGDGRVVRHVLRLERPHLEAAAMKSAGKASDDDGLAHVGARPGKHDGAHTIRLINGHFCMHRTAERNSCQFFPVTVTRLLPN